MSTTKTTLHEITATVRAFHQGEQGREETIQHLRTIAGEAQLILEKARRMEAQLTAPVEIGESRTGVVWNVWPKTNESAADFEARVARTREAFLAKGNG